ncbi:WD repeat protein [Aspergillus heteromorphus CBS 117.55]|uniref:WD repeat protein n=1 Tax=Aspergillus heteromorphus CBS 117.55 TaxID=1448321 RepID=A0A317UZU7_9EURO|nr:WD repeat protein [Aspergillus heteromorphus CBS 117.55]PWY66418.1 WD repeat protein [Aspergillus heteromorphus CBS 117.55]
MRAVLPGRPPTKLQSFSTALWEGIRIVAYISGHALVVLGGPHQLLQTIYVDDTEALEAVTIDEVSGKIAVCGGPDVFIYQPYGIQHETLKWSLVQTFRSEDDDETIHTLSWGSSEELLLGNSHLTLWFLNDTPRQVWKQKVAAPVKFAQFSPDATILVTTGHYDRMAKVWRRLAFGTDIRFEVSYLSHPTVVTGIHWRRPYHREQSMENVFYTLCADNKIRVWATIDHHAPSALQLWAQIDMAASVQPRHTEENEITRRYGFIVDSRDFCVATERAVQRGTGNKGNHALEHIIEVANKSPEVCVVLDGQGHMSAWALEDVGSKAKSELNMFNILHVEGLNFSLMPGITVEEDYAQLCAFQGAEPGDSISVLVHHFDGRIEWYESPVDVLFDPAPRKNRISLKASWTGHNGPIKKIVRNAIGHTLASRTDDSKALIWRQKRRDTGTALLRQSTLLSDEHIHRSCVLEDGDFLVNLHHNGISFWDIRPFHAKKLASTTFKLSGKPLCVLPIPTAEKNGVVYIATIAAGMDGIVWEFRLPTAEQANGKRDGAQCQLRKFCDFHLGLDEDMAYILPVDPAGRKSEMSGFFDLFSPDIALSYTKTGIVRTWTAKIDKVHSRVEWLLTSTAETGIANPSLASGSSIKKAALVDEDRTHLTIWDMNDAQLEFEEHFSQGDIIRDLDWTSTPDMQSILAVGFPHKVILLSQLRYDYLDSRPSWTQIREIWIRDLTPHPIGDSCWLSNGCLAIGAGNQLFVYGNEIDTADHLVSQLRIPARGSSTVDLFEVVSRLNGPLPVFHPQFLAQCILSGKTNLVHSVLMNLHRKLKFHTDGDDLDGFLDMPVEDFWVEHDTPQKATSKEMNSSYADISIEDESLVVDENTALILNENLARFALPQLSSQEQFRLVDTIECVATVEKHRRSMDDNAARYLLFFRQHMLRRSQGVANKDRVSWREIVWAFYSGSQDILVDLVSRQFGGKMTWKSARESGIFMWLSNPAAVRAQLEVVARNEYTSTEERNPIDCSLYYLALKKKNVLQGLWRMAHWHREQNATQRLLSNDFQEERWKTAALKNAYALLGKRRFEYAATFFLLAGHLRDAALVCINQVGDLQLAIAITRAYEGDDGPVLKEILEERVLPEAASDGNRWMASWAFWMLGRRGMAVRSLISPVESLIPETPASPGSPGMIPLQAKSYLSNDPALVVLYKQLREKTLQTIKGASKVSAQSEWNFIIRNARLYDRMGCDLLALDLVRHWEFLAPQPPKGQDRPLDLQDHELDYRKMLRRRSSLVVADLPVRDNLTLAQKIQPPAASTQTQTQTQTQKPKPKPPPTMFHEPDANSLLDSFGF